MKHNPGYDKSLKFQSNEMKKILVIGTSGSGKSSVGNELSELLHVQFFPSDNFYWEVGWKVASHERVYKQVRDVISKEEWILDGNFDDERDLVWKKADCIIWLDYSFPTILRQITSRNFRWVLTRKIIWSGNIMTFQRAILGIQHAIKSYSLKKKNYPTWLAELPNATIYRLCTKQETEAWLESLHS